MKQRLLLRLNAAFATTYYARLMEKGINITVCISYTLICLRFSSMKSQTDVNCN